MKRSTVFTLASSVVLGSLIIMASLAWRSGDPVPLTVKPEAPRIIIDQLPLDVPEEYIPALEDQEDLELQSSLDAIVAADPRMAGLARNKKLSIGVVDLQDPLHARFAAVNGDHMMYAASLPKIAVLLASADALERGLIAETPEVRRDMRLMIARSDNAATTRMIERIGLDHISQVLRDPCYDLYNPSCGGGLWVGKPYGKGGVRKGDPMKNLSHAATVAQVCKYYYKLAFGQLVSVERSRQMLDMLVDPELHHKFVNVLDRVAPNAQVFRKSGTWQNWHADSALVWDKTRRYIVVALAEDAGGESIMRDLMLRIDKTLNKGGGA